MEGFSWLLLSWVIVGALCWFLLNNLGTAEDQSNIIGTASSSSMVMPYSSSSSSSSSSSDWLNELIAWLWVNFRRVPEPLEAWIKSLNEAAKKVTTPSKCEILFESFGDNHGDHDLAPKIHNIRVETGPRDHLTFHGDVRIPLANLRLVSSQRTVDRLLVSNYNVTIHDLHGEVQARVACIANQLYLMACFNGRPEMEIQLINTDMNTIGQVDEAMVEDAVRRCLVSAVTNVNLSDLAENLANSSFVEQRRNSAPSSAAVQEPVQEMFRRLNQAQMIAPHTNLNTLPNKLRVKVIRAQRLGKDTDVDQPFIVLEMDEPPKKATTSRGLGISPYWDESFDFDLTPASEEILFEVYEAGGGGHLNAGNIDGEQPFLGLAIVGFEEIRRSGEAIHSLTLQGRPYRNDQVSGTLTVQFDFYVDPTVSTIGRQIDSVLVRDSDGGEFRETVTITKRPIYDPHDSFETNDIVPTRTTTVLVKSVSQTAKEPPSMSIIESAHGSMEEAIDPLTARTLDLLRSHTPTPPPPPAQVVQQQQQEAMSNSLISTIYRPDYSSPLRSESPELPSHSPDLDNRRQSRGRDKKKKEPSEKRERSFFGELKDRLSGRKSSSRRAKSVEVGHGIEIEEAVSLPPSRDTSQTRYGNDKLNHLYYETKSEGGRSGESSKSMYQHSTLVLEVIKDKTKRYYLIPPSIVHEPGASKLMKHGKKLHIYNEHTFVAVKIRGGATCQVCQHRIARSFTKQGYQCRDCRMVCHKTCHYKTDTYCTASTVGKLNIAKDIDWVHFLSHYQLEEFISLDGV